MYIGGEIGGHHHTAGIGVGRHGEVDAAAAAHRAIGSRPVGKLPACVGDGGDGGAGGPLFDHLAGGAFEGTTAGRDKFHRNLGPAHRDGIVRNQPKRGSVGFGDVAQRLGTAVLGDVGVGAQIVKISGDSHLGQVNPVRQGIVFFGPAGGGILQHFGGVEELVPLLLAHLDDGRIVSIHLGHGQVCVFPLLVQRRNGAHNDVGVGPGGGDGLEPFPITLDKLGGVGGGTGQIVGAKSNDDPPGFELGHRIGDGVHGAVTFEGLTLQGGDRTGPHADHPDVVGQRGEGSSGVVGVHHVTGGVGISDEKGFIHIAAPGVGSLRQDGGRRSLCRGGFGLCSLRGLFGGGGGQNDGGGFGGVDHGRGLAASGQRRTQRCGA